MKKNLISLLFLAMLFSPISSYSQIDPYPNPAAGYKRIDIVIPLNDDNTPELISIEIGIMTNNCNAFSVMAKLTPEYANTDIVTGSFQQYKYWTLTTENKVLQHYKRCQKLTYQKFIPASWGVSKESIIYERPKFENYDGNDDNKYTKVLYVPENFVIYVKSYNESKIVEY